MTDFVLVHGPGHGGWCWRFLVPLLRGAGYDVMITHPDKLAKILIQIAKDKGEIPWAHNA